MPQRLTARAATLGVVMTVAANVEALVVDLAVTRVVVATLAVSPRVADLVPVATVVDSITTVVVIVSPTGAVTF